MSDIKLDEAVTNGVLTVTDKIMDSKSSKTTVVVLAVGAAGIALGWLGKTAWNKLKKKRVEVIEAEVVDNGNREVH